ncbi:UDP-3-O-acyl-N-acetylglucosamine deacetylase [Acidisoma cladoniae]|jgi:UDP-3-O-[3-hydroxymyristoyl] N-acetylglucosamine deacetylase|uniref:UDP-3-O-acyl-N-acetylglucosamine deacetylase n=1 Tax=Acidisoma cladoniae TaxID=3040935 RepID=UPI00254D205A|nr:UDP-3-O-acyl-N-acetylglucosamine deacetylase [Acidisoma sp. PAMC 29798]
MDGLPGYYTETAVSTCSRTLRNPIDCQGVGLHSGRTTRLALLPAPAGSGIVFCRTDLGIDIAARYDLVSDTRLCTKLASSEDPTATIGTVEHLMAALAATGIDSLRIEVDGPELPIFDGSSAPFLFLIDCAGIVELSAPREMIEIVKTVSVEENGAVARFEPLPAGRSWLGLDIAMSIDFEGTAIGQQSFNLRLSEQSFRSEVAEARTFVQAGEIAKLRAAGLARGGNMDNAIVVDGQQILNPSGLRMANEFVRHKALDAVGDLSLAGATILGRFVGSRSGHRMNNLLLRALFADAQAWRPVTGFGAGRAFGSAAQMPLGMAASAA